MTIYQRRTRRDGAVAWELANCTLFLLLPMLLGLWEVGQIIYTKQLVSNAAREAARAASAGLPAYDYARIRSIAESYLRNSGITNLDGVTITVKNLTKDSGSSYGPNAADQLDEFEVTISVPLGNVRWSTAYQFDNTTRIDFTARWYSMKDVPITINLASTGIPQTPLRP